MRYAAVIFDIIESRRYNDRYDVQNILMESISYLNWVYGDAIKKEVVSSAGDEFQGLFNNLQTAFLYVRKLQLLIYPIKIRCGIGYGDIKYDVEKWTSPAIDGEAYYLCRDAINSIPKRKSNVICFNTASKYDKYLNMFCMSDIEIKAKQSQMVRLIELVADIISPIIPTEEDMNFYDFILKNRIRLIEQESWNRVIGKFREVEALNINFEQLFEIKQTIETKNSPEDTFYMEDFWIHGMSTYIAQIVNTTRQNIDRYVSLGKVKESRTMDKAIYELLGEKIWETL